MIAFLIFSLIKTTCMPVIKKCSKCNKSFQVNVLISSYNYGSGDLDLRPPPMQRDTMETWIQRCPHCGYSSPDVETINSITPEFLQSQKYQSILTDTKYPPLCISFLCWAESAKELKLFNESATAYLHASWVCDDKLKELSKESIELRKKCIDEIEIAHKNNQLINPSPKSDELIMLDLLRRTGQFDSCIEYAKNNFDSKGSEFYDKIAHYQIELCKEKDQKVHKLNEVKTKYDL